MATITIPAILSAFLTLVFTLMPVTVLLEPPLFCLMCTMAVTLVYILKCQLKAADLFIFFMFSHRTPPQRIVCNMTRLRVGILKDNAHNNKSTTSKDPLPIQFHIHTTLILFSHVCSHLIISDLREKLQISYRLLVTYSEIIKEKI